MHVKSENTHILRLTLIKCYNILFDGWWKTQRTVKVFKTEAPQTF